MWLSKIMRLPVLIFDLPLCSFARKIPNNERRKIMDSLQTGDILLTADKLFPVWQVAVGFLGSPRYSHIAIYEREQQVVEATTFHSSGFGVAHTVVDEFLSGRKNICVLRPAYYSEDVKNEMFFWLRQQMGKSYDYSFNSHNDSVMYCAELVGKAMKVAGFRVGTKRFLHRNLYVPDAFIRTEGLNNIIYHKSETTAEKLLNYLSLMLGLSVWLLNVAPLWILCLVLLGVGGLQLKMKV